MLILEGNDLETMVEVTESLKKIQFFPWAVIIVICPYCNLTTLYHSDICLDQDLCECHLHKTILDQI